MRKVPTNPNTRTRPVRQRAPALRINPQRKIPKPHASSNRSDVRLVINGDVLEVLKVDDERLREGVAARRE